MSLARIYQEEKAISSFPGWARRDENGYLWFDAPLEIGGVVQAGLVLHGGCFEDKPDRQVTFELRFPKSPGAKHQPLARIDWHPFDGGHSNKRRRPYGLSARIEGSHHHSFNLNYKIEEDRMKANMPLAEDLIPEPQDFQSLRLEVGKLFRISNMNLVKEPEWGYKLPLGGPDG